MLRQMAAVALGALALAALAGGTANAQDKCAGSKLKATGKKAGARLGCFSKAAAKALPVDDACLTKSSTSFSSAFSKAEAKGCNTTGDTAAIEAKVDAFVLDVNSELYTSGEDKCAGSKLKAAGKKAAGILGCHAKAASKNTPVDLGCTGKVEGKFTSAFSKAETKGGCNTTGDAAAIEAKIDAFVTDVVNEIQVRGGTTTTTIQGAACGNGTIEGPAETCDDHNTVDETTVDTLPPDPCPANCRIESCATPAGSLAVSVNFSSTSSVAGYKVFVNYPENKVTIPGIGQPAAGVISNDPTASATGNDLDYGLIVVAGGLNAIAPSRLFTINFTGCGSTPTAAEFGCKVHQASDPNGNDVPMTCSVSIP